MPLCSYLLFQELAQISTLINIIIHLRKSSLSSPGPTSSNQNHQTIRRLKHTQIFFNPILIPSSRKHSKMAQNFVAQLPIVSRTNLVYGNRCGICREIYETKITGSGIVTEEAVLLPCGHEFGYECLSTWLSPEEGNNSCPLCRTELFHAAPTAEEEPAPSRRNSEIDDDIATELDFGLSANGIVYRTPHFRDWLLYSQLQGQGANVPLWRPDSANARPRLNSSEEEALFRELQRRGAFRVLPVARGMLLSQEERDIWWYLRERGYSYDPIYAETSGGCAWTQT